MKFYLALFLVIGWASIMKFGVGIPFTDTFVGIILMILLVEHTT